MSMLYATDIVKLGDQKIKWLPEKNEEYPIFNEPIYCPIDGTIVKVENSISDNKPFAENFPYNTGNTVVIQKDNYYFLLGHLKQGSIVVKEGDVVLYGKYSGTEISYGGKNYLIMKESDIYAIV